MWGIVLLSVFVMACSNSNISDGNAERGEDYDFAGEAISFDIYFYIDGDDWENGEPIWCGDSLSYITRTIYGDYDPLWDAIDALLSVDMEIYHPAGLENVFASSNLVLDDVFLTDDNRTIIYISWDLVIGGICDHPRIKEQLTRTIGQFFESTNDFDIMINWEDLDSVLSLE